MKFSIFYRLRTRNDFFLKWWEKESKKHSKNIQQTLMLNMYETMEIIVVHIVNRNIENLKLLLTKTNAKQARTIFDFILGTNIKKKNKNEIIRTIDEIFKTGVYENDEIK